jgi:predicted DNA-binding transcriptional regulator YafY
VAARFHLDPVAWYRAPERSDILPALAQAVWDSRRIHIRYESWTGVVDRELSPLGLALKAGVWYLVAAAGNAPRTYRVSAIHALEPGDETFERPAGFELATYWTTWARAFETRIHGHQARLRVSSAGLERLSGLGPAVGEARRAGPRDAAGWTAIELPIESIDRAAGEILKLGADAEVLAPPGLREAVAGLARRIADLYGVSGAGA